MIDIDLFKSKMERKRMGENTITSYIQGMQQYSKIYSDVTEENNEGFVGLLQSMGKSTKTINIRIAGINKYCELFNIPIRCQSVQCDYGLDYDKKPTMPEYHKFISLLKNDSPMWYARTLILSNTGARVGEVVQITKADWDNGYCEKMNKGANNRIFFLDTLKNQVDYILKDLEPDDYIFSARRDTKKPMNQRSVRKMMHDFATKYGFPEPERFHPHAFRHLCAREMIDAGVPITDVAFFLNHKNVNVTMYYLRDSKEKQAEKYNKYIRNTGL